MIARGDPQFGQYHSKHEMAYILCKHERLTQYKMQDRICIINVKELK